MEKKLLQLECPFTWDVPEPASRNEMLKSLHDNEEQSDFLFNGFCIFLLELFERARGDEIELAIRKAKECELELEEYLPIGTFSEIDEYLWQRSKTVMWHILWSTQAHLALRDYDNETVEKKLKLLKKVSIQSFNDSNHAALWGIKSRFLQAYGFGVASVSAIKCSRNAVKLDETVPMWHFLLGKSLARYRRNESPFEVPNPEEVESLEKAWSLCKKPDIGVMLLQSYQALINRNVFQKANVKEVVLNLIEQIKLYASNEWYIYWRCAHVCIRLPNGFVPKEEIKNIIETACKFSEQTRNKNQKHLWEIKAAYYKFIEKNDKETLKFSILAADAGEITCVYDVIRLHYTLYRSDDLVPVIDKYLNMYEPLMKTLNMWIMKANYLMYVKHDTHKAFEIYFKIMEENPCAYLITHCRPLFREHFGKSYSLYDKLKREMERAMAIAERNDDYSSYCVHRKYLDTVIKYEKISQSKFRDEFRLW